MILIAGYGTYRKIELRVRNIIPSIRRLHNHLLPHQRGIREGQLVARATGRIRA